MANAVQYKEKMLTIGDTITIDYKIRENNKERIQEFKGIVMGIKGMTADTRMITVRKVSKTGIGVERIIPLASPFIDDIHVDRKSDFAKSKLYFIRELSDKQLRHKLYRQK